MLYFEDISGSILHFPSSSFSNFYFCFIDYAQAFDCVDHNELWKIPKKKGIPDHLTCLLRNQYVGQEAAVKTRFGTTEWFKIVKRKCQVCLLSLCLYIMWNAGMEESQAGIKTAGRNINNLRYADDTTLMAENEEELYKASWWKWKRRVKKLA